MSEFLRCRDCKHDKGKCVGLSRRGGHKNCFEPREITNADRIRAMSDEELAEYLCGLTYCCECKYQDACNDCGGDGYLKWLKRPAEEGLHG